jgi:small subunit ribosomal protein S14
MDITFVTTAKTDNEAKNSFKRVSVFPIQKYKNNKRSETRWQKESMKARDAKRARLTAKIRRQTCSIKSSWRQRRFTKSYLENSSKVRMRNRCKLTGRPRGYMRLFGISRVTFREMATFGKKSQV